MNAQSSVDAFGPDAVPYRIHRSPVPQRASGDHPDAIPLRSAEPGDPGAGENARQDPLQPPSDSERPGAGPWWFRLLAVIAGYTGVAYIGRPRSWSVWLSP